MTAHHDPEIIDLSGNHRARVVVAIVTVLAIAMVVWTFFPAQDASSVGPVSWRSRPMAIFVGVLAGIPFGLIVWASAPKRLVIDDRAIALERVVSKRVIPLLRVSSVQIVLKTVSGQTFRVVTLLLRSGEEVVMPAPDGGIDDVYIAISSRLPARPVDRPQASPPP